ncbi:hypothetical protein B0H12DRAFT_1056947 [Mycena haematopus]|nr:hypothetical protein B0H12DRAFT_1056947 [Mycena haematopus]
MKKAESVLPVHRVERQLAFNSKVDRVPSSANRLPLIGRVKDSTFGNWVYQLWRVCTSSLEGSLSETFKLVSSDDSDDARTSASGKIATNVGDDDSYLDAVVVDNDDYLEAQAPGHHQSDSSQRSGQGGSNSTQTGPGFHRDFHDDNGQHYQGGLKSWIIYRGWPEVVNFFEPRLPEHEEEFQRQNWHSTKLLAFSASLFLVLNWVLYLLLNNDSTKHSLYAKIAFWGGLSLVTIPTPFMVALDMPRKFPITFQIWFCVAVWYCAVMEVIQIKQCHFFSPANKCFGKDFLANYYYATGLPTLMMFVISKRLYNFVAQVIYFILLMVLVIPDQTIFARNVVTFVIFSLFIQGLHYMMENSQRKMFLLALQLRAAFKAKHKAKLAESKASFTKRRFANYIFHEVRVPLNNAVLAFQLLQSGNAFKEDYTKSTEIYALEQGLKMMKTVLNDVLDFEKMDSGHFETVAKPFPLHHSIRTILDQVEVQTGARKLILDRGLDERIDTEPLVLEPGRVAEPEGLWVIGSELRLHQVLTNLATNAVKYTPEGGGSVRISTEFLGISMRDELPGIPPDIEQENELDRSMEKTTNTRVDTLDHNHSHGVHGHRPNSPALTRNGSGGSVQQTQCLKFRLVVHDSGPGIKPSDLVEDRLFQPFVQTTVGQSSGSGTGLGLAIVKQIIRLSGGRLGVTSRRGEGSKFWIELSYPIASAADVQAARESNTLTSLPYEHRNKYSGYISGPLVTATPDVVVKSQDGALAFAVATEAAARQPEAPARPPMPPQYESNPKATTTATTPTPLNSVVSSSDPLRVLVVDDDAVTRVLSSKLLTKLGCIVHTAKDGKECLDMVLSAEPHTYDLICLDNFMPVMTGEDAVKEIRASDRDDFVVGCTGNALTEDQDSYREAGADEVMVKPVMIHDFKKLIQMAQQRRLERRARAS